MKKIIILFIISYLFQSCIALKFPDKMEINISVPEDYDIRGTYVQRNNDNVDKANQLLDKFSNLIKKMWIKV